MPDTAETSAVAQAAMEGLSANPKFLPSWLFYDDAGSQLFEAITRLPEYYLTAREHSIFCRHAGEIIAAAVGMDKQPLSVVELGAGSASKTLVLLRALIASQGRAIYMPVDVSEAALQWADRNVRAALPTVDVQPICSEITHESPLDLPAEGRRLALYIGSSIGNFDPEDAVELLAWLRSQLQPGDALLLGTDMVKRQAPLLAAYNDQAGVTAEFNKNILTRLNRELEAGWKCTWTASARTPFASPRSAAASHSNAENPSTRRTATNSLPKPWRTCWPAAVFCWNRAGMTTPAGLARIWPE
jgi:dimethylhistidine N-methyltransferase